MKKIKSLLTLLLLLVMLHLPILIQAQPPDDGDDVLDNPVPFDGGAILLAAAGVTYGLKKAKERKTILPGGQSKVG